MLEIGLDFDEDDFDDDDWEEESPVDKARKEIELKNDKQSDVAKLVRYYKKLGYTTAEIKLKVNSRIRRARDRSGNY